MLYSLLHNLWYKAVRITGAHIVITWIHFQAKGLEPHLMDIK